MTWCRPKLLRAFGTFGFICVGGLTGPPSKPMISVLLRATLPLGAAWAAGLVAGLAASAGLVAAGAAAGLAASAAGLVASAAGLVASAALGGAAASGGLVGTAVGRPPPQAATVAAPA